MSKMKYERVTKQTICGVLDFNEDNELVIIVDEDEFELSDIVNSMVGTTITLTNEDIKDLTK